MGLDQYAHKVKRDYNYETLTETIVKTQIAYWRKHNALEGYMSDLYRDKTGDEGVFNCKIVTLDSDDLDHLEEVIVGNELPETEGFFFGESSKHDEGRKQADREFIAEARKSLDEGYTIEYTSWW